jgi:hypothetical protein
MLSFLKNHPFAVEAFFERSIVLTFAVPEAALRHMIPPCLTLDTFDDKWAFIAVAMVRTTGLRPKGFPAFSGHDFFLIGYRIFVRYTSNSGKRLRGLYILKSETDKMKMQVLGNIFTQYRYTTTDVAQVVSGNRTTIKSIRSGLEITCETPQEEDTPLPVGSPFADWSQARRFAGPLPFTFTYNDRKRQVLIIEGVRQNWTPRPITVVDYHISFLSELYLDTCVLANAFIIKNIPYHWKKGRLETWNG